MLRFIDKYVSLPTSIPTQIPNISRYISTMFKWFSSHFYWNGSEVPFDCAFEKWINCI